MLRLRDIMTRDVLTVGPTTTLREAAELLATRHIGGVPVVEGSRLLGVVSATDILAFAAAATDEPQEPPMDDADEWIEPGGGGESPARWMASLVEHAELDVAPDDAPDGPSPLDRHTVAEVMTRRVVALPPDADAVTAAARLRTADVHRVLVVDADRLLGIVTTTDITRAVADRALERRTYVFAAAR
ncbi:CBS domain-containing protein [Roseisolibacter agri]|uniref:CBS domain-containing protein n=1 Tax=Roseisolibacter agri TaxID=2014610 RepID=A0AA37V0N9_9BACT|nr:CBS domain-containing protein [Roseisolibacter agri]GLC24880.1 hypothetical protein rosag_13930 [Roseisolibacter agri]